MLLLCLATSGLNAVYIQVYKNNTNGGIAFTGNTLGLNKKNNENAPGIAGSIGAFISTNQSLTVSTWKVDGKVVPGLTLDWRKNGSTANLDLPPGSTILHAELIWSGSYGFKSDVNQHTSNNPVCLTIPGSEANCLIYPKDIYNPATGQGTGQFRKENSVDGFYVRSADVTALLQSLGQNAAGVYAVGGVPGTVTKTENNLNCAGWTLAVAYANPNMLTSNLNLYVACEASGAAATKVEDFIAPDSTNISSRLFVSALEGDAQLAGDQFVIGPSKHHLTALEGDNNPKKNFFASQINTLLHFTTDFSGKYVVIGDGTLDTRGSFGYLNSNAFEHKSVSGARQGYDITSIDIGKLIAPKQDVLWCQGTTDQDVYTITGLGIQIQQKAPLITAIKSADKQSIKGGEMVTFYFTFENKGEVQADCLMFTDVLPSGLTYVNNTFFPVAIPHMYDDGTNTVMALLGDLAVNGTITFQFTALSANNIPPPDEFINSGSVSYYPDGDPDQNLITQTNEVVVAVTNAPQPLSVITANDDYGSVQNGKKGGVAVDNVLENDTLNGETATLSTVRLTQLKTTNPNVHLSNDPNSAAVVVDPGTKPGTYYVKYRICDLRLPSNCDSATVTVTVGGAEIIANNDIGSVPTSPEAQVAIENVLANDSLDGVTPTLNDVTLSVISKDPNLILDTSTGQVIVKPDTPPGVYSLLSYKICDKNEPTNCSSAQVIVIVTSPVTPIPPDDFTGVVKKCVFLNKTAYRLIATWHGGNQDIHSYRIYKNDNVVAEIPADQPLVYETCLKSKAEAQDFAIASVGQDSSMESIRVKIRIVYE